MKKLLLGMFTVLALNVQGQSLTDTPVVMKERSEIAHFLSTNHFCIPSQKVTKITLLTSIMMNYRNPENSL